VIEAESSIANPDHAWWHVVGDVSLCPELSPLILDLERITIGELSRICVDLDIQSLGGSVVFPIVGLLLLHERTLNL